jgi:hypothetical protein
MQVNLQLWSRKKGAGGLDDCTAPILGPGFFIRPPHVIRHSGPERFDVKWQDYSIPLPRRTLAEVDF